MDKRMELQEQIWQNIARMDTPGFYIAAEMACVGTQMPETLGRFIGQKLEKIRQGITARRFVFSEGEWRIYLTFFPTDRVVDEKYALKNKVMSRHWDEAVERKNTK